MHVVTADDSELMLELVSAVLAQRGHTVEAVSDGTTAWAAIERTHPPLVLLDWQMPGLNGLQVCRLVREDVGTANTFVVMVTGRDQPDDLAEALAAGADDYVHKPITAKELHARCTIAERRIELDEVRRTAESTALRAEWLAGIGQTALSVQHEVNNPLAALLSYVGLSEIEGTTDRECREYMRAVDGQARRIAAVVKRLASLEDPRTVEYLRGTLMLDLGVAT
jgi:DNA-binding response OmpR family regulator